MGCKLPFYYTDQEYRDKRIPHGFHESFFDAPSRRTWQYVDQKWKGQLSLVGRNGNSTFTR